jgi:hypothetical protein
MPASATDAGAVRADTVIAQLPKIISEAANHPGYCF